MSEMVLSSEEMAVLPTPVSLDASAQLWGSGLEFSKQNFQSYFQYYIEQCRVASHSHGSHFVIKTHQNIVDIATRIRDGLPRSEVKDFVLQSRGTNDSISDDEVNSAIDLTVRLLYMLDVGKFQNAYSGRNKLMWISGSAQDFLHQIFTDAISRDDDGIRLDKTFNVCSITRVGGFKVELTSNLSDHLRLRDADKTITLFHYASFLKANKETSGFPFGLIDETLATLALLFPQGNREVERWYKKQDEPDELDGSLLRCGNVIRQMKDFHYWYDRLAILKNDFDDSKPSTLQQWWNDRRDASQWYPLWVAISLTVLFGLVQSIEGALQVYKAYNP
ncbi:hypothetical protein N7532_007505 [Penicillium argentinense]|uniref:Uncharacterized protein n=1 Tax=Penicillium argentinense TaxID=1131581 RepID=A0A9W9F7V1_9EURO|nr:uncharacterized protein N7532_007505 [Penicillium argentinense]KAJ5095214.1 hypothetical protein N7532_007505 [Penicillium argentinense]